MIATESNSSHCGTDEGTGVAPDVIPVRGVTLPQKHGSGPGNLVLASALILAVILMGREQTRILGMDRMPFLLVAVFFFLIGVPLFDARAGIVAGLVYFAWSLAAAENAGHVVAISFPFVLAGLIGTGWSLHPAGSYGAKRALRVALAVWPAAVAIRGPLATGPFGWNALVAALALPAAFCLVETWRALRSMNQWATAVQPTSAAVAALALAVASLGAAAFCL